MLQGDNAYFQFNFEGYHLSDGPIVDGSFPNINYYLFIDRLSNWYIMKEDTTAKSYRFKKGSPIAGDSTTTYAYNWTNRESGVYGYFDAAFSV
jgi:hypothetical protein